MSYSPHDDLMAQRDEFSKALGIMQARVDVYQDAWRQSGAMSQARRARDKVDRFMRAMAANPERVELEDAYDAMNHLAFATRCMIEGNVEGASSPMAKDRINGIIDELKDAAAVTERAGLHDELMRLARRLEEAVA